MRNYNVMCKYNIIYICTYENIDDLKYQGAAVICANIIIIIMDTTTRP